MREIKFRAWLYPYKRMAYEFNLFQKKGCFHLWLPGEEFSPDAFELMRYIGLKDSYATEEYFGDIIEDDDGIRRVIEDGNSAVWYKNIKEKFDIDYFWQLKVHKVIGNIYENPDLLKEAK